MVIFKSYVQLTERDDEMAILATVILADHTGEIERILVDEQNLQALAAVASKDQLLTLLQKRGPQGICFKHPVDVRLATNNCKAGISRSNVPPAASGVLQTQESETATVQLPECQFQLPIPYAIPDGCPIPNNWNWGLPIFRQSRFFILHCSTKICDQIS